MAEVESMLRLNRHSTVVLSWLLMLMRRSSYTAQLDKIHNLVRHQKWSEPIVFLTFWLPNVLRATTACTFSRSELPKVVRTPSVLYNLTSKCASRHNGVHFFDISIAKSGPNPWCVLYILTSKCASRQNGVNFFDISTTKSAPTMVCF